MDQWVGSLYSQLIQSRIERADLPVTVGRVSTMFVLSRHASRRSPEVVARVVACQTSLLQQAEYSLFSLEECTTTTLRVVRDVSTVSARNTPHSGPCFQRRSLASGNKLNVV